MDVLYADYNTTVGDPEGTVDRIQGHLPVDVDCRAMAEVVDPDLYRNRAGELDE
jgi:hypothetical protein